MMMTASTTPTTSPICPRTLAISHLGRLLAGASDVDLQLLGTAFPDLRLDGGDLEVSRAGVSRAIQFSEILGDCGITSPGKQKMIK